MVSGGSRSHFWCWRGGVRVRFCGSGFALVFFGVGLRACFLSVKLRVVFVFGRRLRSLSSARGLFSVSSALALRSLSPARGRVRCFCSSLFAFFLGVKLRVLFPGGASRSLFYGSSLFGCDFAFAFWVGKVALVECSQKPGRWDPRSLRPARKFGAEVRKIAAHQITASDLTRQHANEICHVL